MNWKRPSSTQGRIDTSIIGGGGYKKLLPEFSRFLECSGTFKVKIQCNENIQAKDSFKFEHSIRAGNVSARTMHLFYVIYTF